MTHADQLRQQQLARQQDGQDLGDIDSLLKYEPFSRYWMRCLQQKCSALEKSFKYDKLSPEDREAKRQQILMLEELRDMPKAHRATLQKSLEAPPPQAGQRPMQAN